MKLRIISLVLFCILLSTANAQNDVPFAGGVGIGPPPPPGLENLTVLTLELREFTSDELLKNSHVNLEIINLETNESSKTIRYVGETGSFQQNLEPGSWRFVLELDKIETDGKDYYADFYVDLLADTNKIVYMKPTGSVRGIVYKEDKVVPGARVKFECSGSYGSLEEVTTDDFGSFTGDWLPIGSCKIFALHEGWMGSKDVEIKAGELEDIRIDLTSETLGGSVLIFILIILILIVLGGAYFYYFKIKAKPKEEKIIEEPGEEKPKLSKKMQTVMETLKDEEKEVVQFLIDNEKKSTQAKIFHGTGIPKTSLHRYIRTLENKKIVKTKMFGKVKKIELSDWFLGKE